MKKEKKVNRCGQKSVFKGLVLIVGFLALLPLAASPGWASSLLFIGDAGNADDAETGYGEVSYSYYMSKYEVTNQEYTDFLNDVAAIDTYNLYSANMGSNARGGINQSGTPGSYTYTVKTDFGNRPVNYVSWYDAARYCNWLHSGDTEDGAYTTSGDWSADHTATGGNYWIPTEDEWYKAAYYSGSGATYYDYATQSDDAPTEATADDDGNVSNSGANIANYDRGFIWNDIEGDRGNVSIVGDCESDSGSHYGTFDQSGNVWEWNEDWYQEAKRLLRGGSWLNTATYLPSSFRAYYSGPDGESSNMGFRVASSIPEPSALLLFSPVLPWLFWYARRKRRN